MTTTYQYKPLGDPDNEIRLAVIQPGAFDDDIRIAFKLRKLEETNPAYEALSYAWGTNENPSSVIVNGGSQNAVLEKARGLKQLLKTWMRRKIPKLAEPELDGEDAERQAMIPATRNLDIALRHLRYPTKERVIWIDALSIDQESTDEKNQQVAAMGRIFSSAKVVVLWVGPEANRSNKALDIIEHIGRRVEANWTTYQLRPSDICEDDDKHWADPAEDLPYRDGALDPVLHLFERLYFNRVWVRQEIALANSSILVCGDRSVDWKTFRRAIACIYLKGFYHDSIANGWWSAFEHAKDALLKICRTSAGVLRYHNLRRYLGGSNCRDPRDKIFSILALLCEEDKNSNIKPDYSQEIEKLYTDVAEHVYVRDRSLSLLEGCVLSSRALDISSWVPDWSTSLPIAGSLEAAWSACAWISPEDLTVDKRSLRSTGVAASFVQEIIVFSLGENVTKPYVEVMRTLRRLMPTPNKLAALSMTMHCFTASFCSALLCGYHAESYLPPSFNSPELTVLIEAVLLVQSTDLDFETLQKQTHLPLQWILNTMLFTWTSYSLFVCDNGYVGCAYPGVQKGDTVSVLLGCMFPLILRPSPQSGVEDPQTWEVVSVAMVAGLMNGEAIYGDKLPSHWRAVQHYRDNNGSNRIDLYFNGFYDTEMDHLRTDPAEILTQMGIKVESYQRYPHQLVVLPETLRAAGVPLREFILV